MSTPTDSVPTPTPAPAPAPMATISVGRMSPAVLIAIVGVGVLLLGALVFFIGRATSGTAEAVPLEEQGAVLEETSEVLEPIPDTPAPSVEPIPEQPTVEPIPEQPTAEQPPAEQPPAEQPPAEQPPAEPVSTTSGQTIDIGIASAAVPAGWEAQAINDATVSIFTNGGGAIVTIYTAPAGATAGELVSFYVQESLSSVMTDLEITQPEPLSIDVPSITSAASNLYRGTYVSQQGSVPLEGIIWAFIRGDGAAVVVDGYWQDGVDIIDPLASIAASIAQTM